MTTHPLAPLWPPHGVTISCGPLSLESVKDEHLPELDALIRAGIHPAGQMPFVVPWTTGTPDEVSRRFMQYHWSIRGSMTPTAWTFETVIRIDGTIVGCQGLSTRNFPETRTGETGSWIGQEFQGRGLGTLARQSMCTFAFDHLGATRITSTSFADNPASLTVSRKIGYQDAGSLDRLTDSGRMTVQQFLTLDPPDFVRPLEPVVVRGSEAIRSMLEIV
ncbi:GNAT family N-acetyltransferase [Rhodococcus sp. ARC_M6]|uniref:GNAT family N-acetyltransferase n=1 Tax=Rhodococcus sp. ARC_M6 TaxID=2928852 RepID=UPI001FB1AA05|nr:GNAT family protein [Rhodococcus sp. ARC_M6]MCJ0904327.1 GNAT family N-acetyltransferase [Rhodococcus sp. ARC_M6]